MQTERRLTEFSHGAGCACKLGPEQLREVLTSLPSVPVPDEVLVAAETGDDAAVYQLSEDQAIVATLDFFTPIVDDPFDWGRIAATNAFSDVYAMGGRPIFALNIVAWPVDDLPLEMLGRVLEGGQTVATAAGVPVLGGHSITDDEPKYGMVALGLIDPRRILTNARAPLGARLFLTKPIGLGMISTAIKRGIATERQIDDAVETMTRSNAGASEAMVAAEAAAATDITGFGLLGHLYELLTASGVAADLDASAVPVLDGALELARSGTVAGGTRRNHAFVRDAVDWGALDEPERFLLADAQTSGGLLIAASDGDRLASELRRRGIAAAEIGVTREGRPGAIAISGRVRGA